MRALGLGLGLGLTRPVAGGGGAGGGGELTLDLDFTTGSLDSKVTFTRASTATYFNSSGVLSSAATNAPRFDHDPITLAPRGLLIEEQRTNYLKDSANIQTATAWTITNVLVTPDARIAPDGTLSADNQAGSVAHTLGVHDGGLALYVAGSNLTFASAGQAATGSVWVYSVAGATIELAVFEWGGANFYSGAKVIPAGVWTRVTHTATVSALGNQVGLIIYVGNNNVDLWGAQLEIGSFATSYIPTTTAAVTRAADSAVMTGSNFSSWYAAATGTFVAEFDVASIAVGTRGILSVDNATATERIEFYNSAADPRVIVVDGGATQADLDAGTLVANTPAKLGLSYAVNDIAACLNGGAVVPDTVATVPTPTQALVGASQAGNYLNGHVRSVMFYNVAKSDAELQALTT